MTPKTKLTIERRYTCAPDVLYGAWTDPLRLPLWFGPAGFSCRTQSIDLREGGEWLFEIIGHGMTFRYRHRFVRMVPDQRIEYLLDEGTDVTVVEAVVTFAPLASGARLRQEMTFPTAKSCAEAEAMGAVELGQTTLDKLARLVGSD